MSMITFAVAGPWLYTLIPPLTVPAGTMAAFATIAPCGSFKVATKGLWETGWPHRDVVDRALRNRNHGQVKRICLGNGRESCRRAQARCSYWPR